MAEDWDCGSKGCYDAVSLARLQTTLKYDFKAIANGNNKTCLSQPLADDILDHLLSETYKADAQSLGKLMADHTQVACVCYCSAVQHAPCYQRCPASVTTQMFVLRSKTSHAIR